MFCYNYYTNLDGHDKLPKYCDLTSKDQKKVCHHLLLQ